MTAERPTSHLKEPPSRLPTGGTNLFQGIKDATEEAIARGIEPIKLSIGEPDGWPLESAILAAQEAMGVRSQDMHGYQDNGSRGVPGFSERFVQAHVKTNLEGKNLAYLPAPGTKSMLTIFSLACGGADAKLHIAMMTDPGYPTPKDWAEGYFHHDVTEVELNPENNFRFPVNDIPKNADLAMINYPHNPSGQVATLEQLEELCQYCQDNGIPLVNDAAYAALSHSDESSTLTDVAVNYPGLAWIELFSASKTLGNATGWRIAAAVGTPNFIGDLGKIKGNQDSGFVAPLAYGALVAVETDQVGIEANRAKFGRRIEILKEILTGNGMRLAVEPKAGFFTLWKLPKFAFGEEVKSAVDFNRKMIDETGVVGVPFNTYMRYAVCIDVEEAAEKIDAAFKKAAVSY